MTNLYFGFAISNESPFLKQHKDQLESEKDWREHLAQRAGVSGPPRRSSKDTDETFNARYDRWLELYYAGIESFGCEVVEAGFSERPDYFVAIKFPRGDSKLIKPVDLAHLQSVAADAENRPKLRHFCEVLGFEYKEPAWHELTFYGSLYD
jgi:hypothetical protein